MARLDSIDNLTWQVQNAYGKHRNTGLPEDVCKLCDQLLANVRQETRRIREYVQAFTDAIGTENNK
jgi:hypothetical protein